MSKVLKVGKHSHPDQTVLAAATILLRELRKLKVVSFDDLKAALVRKKIDAEFLYTPALSLLFMLGLVEYLPKNDTFAYVGAA